jgi:hypothetical protein
LFLAGMVRSGFVLVIDRLFGAERPGYLRSAICHHEQQRCDKCAQDEMAPVDRRIGQQLAT